MKVVRTETATTIGYIDRYQKEASRSNAVERQWVVTLKRYIWRTLLYSIILIAITIVARQYLMPWLSEILASPWQRIVCAAVTLAAMSPFLFALLLPISKRNDADATSTNVPRIVMSIFRFVIALMFVVYVLSWLFSMKVGLAAGIAAILLIVMLFSRNVKERMSAIESKFLDNLNERDLRRSGKNNSVVNDLHLAYITVGTGCDFVGERLADSNVRARYGVNIVSIQRGAEVIPIPDAARRVFPGDVIGVIGTDDQIERLLPIVEAQRPATESINPADFKFTSIMLSETSPLIGKTPITSNLRSAYDMLAVAVQRGDTYIDSDPNLCFEPGDILYLVGNTARLSDLN